MREVPSSPTGSLLENNHILEMQKNDEKFSIKRE